MKKFLVVEKLQSFKNCQIFKNVSVKKSRESEFGTMFVT